MVASSTSGGSGLDVRQVVYAQEHTSETSILAPNFTNSARR
jgi:hypothetical protein